MRRWIVVLFLIILWLPAYAAGENWPQFRGPGSRGVAIDSTLPDTWSTTQNVRWKIDIPGSGWSSPVVWGNKIFVTSVITEAKTEEPRKASISVVTGRTFPAQHTIGWFTV